MGHSLRALVNQGVRDRTEWKIAKVYTETEGLYFCILTRSFCICSFISDSVPCRSYVNGLFHM